MPALYDQPIRPANLTSGRYTILGEIASGGMATIRYGRLVGPLGFSRAVVVKQLHPQFAKDENFVSMILDEARLSAHIAHANVVQTIDVLSEPGELSIVMEYVHGESLGRLLEHVSRSGGVLPVRIAVTLVAGVLHGLHSAHETHGEHGEPLHIVHRDVSPENILVGSDGVARLIDFGVARARGQRRLTPAGELKGKLAYMAVEQYRGEAVDRRVDVYGASVVLWEALTGRMLFKGDSDAAVVGAVMNDLVLAPSAISQGVSAELDAVVLKGLARERDERFASAREMAQALERSVSLATQSEVSDWLQSVAGDLLQQRAEMLRGMQVEADLASAGLSTPVTRRLDVLATTPALTGEEALRPPPIDGPHDLFAVTRVDIRESTLRRRPGARRRAWPLVVALGVAVCVVAGWLVSRPASQPTSTLMPPSKIAPRPSVEAEAPGALPVEASLPDAAGAAMSEEQEPNVSLTRPGFDAATPQVVSRARRASESGHAPERRGRDKAKAGPARKAVLDCSQPFWLDARGIRHIKRECLE